MRIPNVPLPPRGWFSDRFTAIGAWLGSLLRTLVSAVRARSGLRKRDGTAPHWKAVAPRAPRWTWRSVRNALRWPRIGKALFVNGLVTGLVVLAVHWMLQQYWQYGNSPASGVLWNLLVWSRRIGIAALAVAVIGIPLWGVDTLLDRQKAARSSD